VVYLPRAADALRELVQQAGIEDEVNVANDAVMKATIRDVDDEASFWRMKGIRDVPRDLLPLVFALWRFREEAAKAANQPAGRIINTEVLYALTRHPPADVASAKRSGVSAAVLARQGERLLQVVADAKQTPPTLPPQAVQHFPTGPQRRREEALKAWRLTEAAALEYAKLKIRINSIGPGYIVTPLLTNALSADVMKSLETLHPMGRLGTSEEVAELALWLNSDKASFVTGSYYNVDGGYLAQ
jgi:NAD(P)-dependent dehydrogenase (short-subunit alcohol dehydrogenase family)